MGKPWVNLEHTTIMAVVFLCISLCLYSPGIGLSSYCPRLWSSFTDIGKASGKDCFVLVPCTGCVCLGGKVVAFTSSFRPRSCAAVHFYSCNLVYHHFLTPCRWVP